MLEFIIFAATFAISLIILIIYVFPARSKMSTIPGINQTDSKEGNFADIQIAGSITKFLHELHAEYGDIASFWMGSEMVVSIASPSYFEQHRHASDRPKELFTLYEPLFGENSIIYSTGHEARKRHKLMKECISNMCNSVTSEKIILELTKELGEKWESVTEDEHIPLWAFMKAFCLKSSAHILLGKHFFTDDKDLMHFTKCLDTCYTELEHQLTEITTEEVKNRKNRFHAAKANMIKKLNSWIKGIERNEKSAFLEIFLKADLSNEVIVDDLITCLFYYFSISSLLTWALYFISLNSDVQSKIHSERNKSDKQCFEYLSKVMKETLRMAPVFSWTARKQIELETEIGGHIIAKNTPVIHAISVVMMSEEYWSMPKLFNPERFENDDDSKFLFAYGFAGNRNCPAEKFILKKLSLFLNEICAKFFLKPVTDQVIDFNYGIITKPSEEIWINLEKRTYQ